MRRLLDQLSDAIEREERRVLGIYIDSLLLLRLEAEWREDVPTAASLTEGTYILGYPLKLAPRPGLWLKVEAIDGDHDAGEVLVVANVSPFGPGAR